MVVVSCHYAKKLCFDSQVLKSYENEDFFKEDPVFDKSVLRGFDKTDKVYEMQDDIAHWMGDICKSRTTERSLKGTTQIRREDGR
jgi:hypothetical protein